LNGSKKERCSRTGGQHKEAPTPPTVRAEKFDERTKFAAFLIAQKGAARDDRREIFAQLYTQ
jgi:hypothetical protein